MNKNAQKALVGLAIGLVFMGLIAWKLDWGQVYDTLAASQPLYLIPISVALVFHYALKGLRWRVLLSDSVDVPPLFAVRLTMVGFFMNNIFPARIGELGRPYLLSANQPDCSFSFAIATVVGDKLFDLLFVILFLLAASMILPMPDYAAGGILILSVACLGVIAASLIAAFWERRERGREAGESWFSRLFLRFGKKGEMLYEVVLNFAAGISTISSVRRAALATLLSALSFALLLGVSYMTMLMVNLEGSVPAAMFVIGMIGIGFMIPSAPTNAGNFHFFAAQALLLTGLAKPDVAFSFAVISHISQVVVVTVAGAASLPGLDWRKLTEDR